MHRIIYTQPDGTLAIVHPAPRARLCKSAMINGERVIFDPPTAFHNINRSDDIDSFDPKWAETEKAFVERIKAKDVPADATDVQIVPPSAIPADRTFRGAWALTGKGVAVNMDAARKIQRDRLREARKPLLADLDVAYQRADEEGDTNAKTAVADKKRRLREVTAAPAIENARTPADLSALTLAELTK